MLQVSSDSVRLPLAIAMLVVSTAVFAQGRFVKFEGAPCVTPPVQHCPDKDCPSDTVGSGGSVVEPKTGRTYFLDYPCNLRKGEKVVFVLSLHGGGSYGNWQRHYFPLVDFKDKYRLVVATPFTPTRIWSPSDDAYLENIAASVIGQLGKENIRAFWLSGHSLGGQTANRLLQTNFYLDRVDGWISLSGGRLGSKRSEVRAAIPQGSGGGLPPPSTGAPPVMRLVADASVLPEGAFSHIYSSGQHELPASGLPQTSKWAEKLKCQSRVKRPDIIDVKPGYVYDNRQQPNANPVWGLKARPGSAEMYVYPGCSDGLVVADVIRRDKGHTEGLEPNVTESLIKLMTSAKGGKLQRLK